MYPTDIKIEKINKVKAIKEKLNNLKEKFKKQIKYLVYDRKHLTKILLVKLHI